MAAKYDAPQMLEELAVTWPTLSTETNSIQNSIVARDLIGNPALLYVLGACFGFPWLEEKYRPHVIENHDHWISSGSGQHECGLLAKWAPQNRPALLGAAC
jgi:hypothetical protein